MLVPPPTAILPPTVSQPPAASPPPTASQPPAASTNTESVSSGLPRPALVAAVVVPLTVGPLLLCLFFKCWQRSNVREPLSASEASDAESKEQVSIDSIVVRTTANEGSQRWRSVCRPPLLSSRTSHCALHPLPLAQPGARPIRLAPPIQPLAFAIVSEGGQHWGQEGHRRPGRAATCAHNPNNLLILSMPLLPTTN